jgi:hypothetical protein
MAEAGGRRNREDVRLTVLRDLMAGLDALANGDSVKALRHRVVDTRSATLGAVNLLATDTPGLPDLLQLARDNDRMHALTVRALGVPEVADGLRRVNSARFIELCSIAGMSPRRFLARDTPIRRPSGVRYSEMDRLGDELGIRNAGDLQNFDYAELERNHIDRRLRWECVRTAEAAGVELQQGPISEIERHGVLVPVTDVAGLGYLLDIFERSGTLFGLTGSAGLAADDARIPEEYRDSLARWVITDSSHADEKFPPLL